MYVSPAVRTVRDDPVEGESVTLLLEATDDDALEAVADAVRELGASVERERQFHTLEVVVAHERVGDVCDLDGIEVVETANTLGVDGGGAGEDVRPDR